MERNSDILLQLHVASNDALACRTLMISTLYNLYVCLFGAFSIGDNWPNWLDLVLETAE